MLPRSVESGHYLSIRDAERLLRQYLPRKLDFSTLSRKELDLIAAELNERPQETLDWKTPAEPFAEFGAMADRAHAVEPTRLDPDTGVRHRAASGGGRPHSMC